MPVLDNLKKYLIKLPIECEIIVVNDGSSDNSSDILKKISEIKIINHPYNKGYGASLKTGIAASQYDWLLFFDADGQHQAESINKLLTYTAEYDLIAGDRSQSKYVRPLLRTPGLWFLRKIALINFSVSFALCLIVSPSYATPTHRS